jgi:hypothetical protein
LIAEHNMSLPRSNGSGASLEDVANWVDDYRLNHPETGPCHYIDIPLTDTRIEFARESRTAIA